MILNLSSEDGHPFHFMQGLPADYKGKLLPAGTALTCIEDFGRLIIQQRRSELYALSYQCFSFNRPVTINWKPKEPRPFSCFAIREDLDEYIGGYGRLKIKQGQFNFQGAAIDGGTVRFAKNKVYESLYTGYADTLLEGIDTHAITKPEWAGKDILRWLDDIFSHGIHPEYEQRYYENKMREYLLLQFGKQAFTQQKKSGLLPHELEAVYETLQIISRDMKEHIPIDEIAKKLKLKNFHLKNIFARHIGMNIYEYQLYQKMMEARRLVLETDLYEKEIADKLGYSGEASFSTAFLKYFGVRPGKLRKDHPGKNKSE